MSARKEKAARKARAEHKGARDAPDASFPQLQSPVIAFGIIALFAAYLHHNLVPLVADADSFYHLRHTWIYRTRGIFDSSFPWTQYSVIRTYAADIWYGFHIATIPFSYFEPLLDGIYWAAFFVTIASLGLIFTAFRALGVRWPLLWTLVVPLMSSDLMYRLTMMRPHPISLGLLLLLFAHLVKERSGRTLAALFVIGALQAWLHLALIWLPVFVAGVVTLMRILHRRLPDPAALGALAAGLAVGIILRPNPVGALKVAHVQIVTLMLEKRDLHLHVGVELIPFYLVNFNDQFVALTVLSALAIGGLVVLIRNRQFATISSEHRVALWSSLTMAVIFFILAFVVARRSHEIFVAFAVIFVAIIATYWRGSAGQPLGAHAAVGLAAVTLVAGAGWSLYRYPILTADTSSDPRRYQDVGTWLAQNAEPGEIVFHPRWDVFGFLFFWNPRNYYINGMDPIFEYAYDRSLYWKTHYLHNGAADEMTCGAYPCVDEVIPTYESMKRDFDASYITFEAQMLPGLEQYLARTPVFTKVFESPVTGAVIYRVD